jgi:hypothetical protein
MNKAIELAQTEANNLESVYNKISNDRRLAKLYGNKAEVAELTKEEQIAWARLSTVLTLIENLKNAERVGA